MERDVKLAGSEFSDCVLCSCIADVNMDGKNEILLGTYNQEVLVYTLVDDTWELAERRLFDAPVHSISYLDLTGDGMKELAVLTQRGVHILQVCKSILSIRMWNKKMTIHPFLLFAA